jgi:hypothetical protein
MINFQSIIITSQIKKEAKEKEKENLFRLSCVSYKKNLAH